jgi:hypothetical protein
MGVPVMKRGPTCRFCLLAIGCSIALPSCLLGGDYKGGGRTIELPGWDAGGGALGSSTVVIDAGAPPAPDLDASID